MEVRNNPFYHHDNLLRIQNFNGNVNTFYSQLREIYRVMVLYFVVFVQLYGMNSIIGHSLWIAVHKYVFIKHAKSVYKFGIEKAKHVFCWLHIILPAICAVGWMFRPYYRAIESVNRCHGGLDWQLFDGKLPKYKVKINETSPITIRKMAEKLFFCGLGYYDGNTFYDNFMYVSSQIYCFTQATWACTVVGNILEIFFYLRIFSFMER